MTTEELINQIDLNLIKKEIECNPNTNFEESDLALIAKGDYQSLVWIAQLFAEGSPVVVKNPDLAFAICNHCIDNGCIDAYHLLADLYEHGIGVKQDYKKSLRILLEGSNKGSADCMCMFVQRNRNHRLCHDGINIASVQDEYEWLKKAADLGCCTPLKSLGFRYLDGIGTPENIEKAIECFKKAQQYGDLNGIIGRIEEKIQTLYSEMALGNREDAESIMLLTEFNNTLSKGHIFHRKTNK